MQVTLQNSILITLAYFDQFSHPLTGPELYRALWQPPTTSWLEFLDTLKILVSEKKIVQEQAFYFLPNNQKVVVMRAANFLVREKKLRLARRLARWLALVPFIQGVFVCNTVAAGWPKENSDIDLLVIIKPGRLWFTRAVFTLVTSLLNRRRHGTAIADHLCLSFYVTAPAFNLQTIRIAAPDIYLVFWLQTLVPLYVEDDVLSEFLTSNAWIKEYTPQAETKPRFQNMSVPNGIAIKIKKNIERVLGQRFGNWLEKKAKQYQLVRIEKKPHQPAPQVVISDTMLKFHEADRREQYQTAWIKKCQSLGL
ncbi:MAG: hypothetical protein KAZ30_03290 [Candidatus Magasanikbacteria bacterium]|nr:hypothetical protein [Candidatus Magasanikbacteria bacterium]